MKARLVFVVMLAVFFSAAAARGTSTPAQLEPVANLFAMRPIHTLCYDAGEPDDPYDIGAWGYVNSLDRDTIHIAKEMCDGALAVANHDSAVPAWERAVGVLVLVHESYHARFWDLWASEAWVECYAIRRWEVATRKLGATDAEVELLKPYALASHYRIGALYPEYNLKTCRVPYFYPPGGPRPHR